MSKVSSKCSTLKKKKKNNLVLKYDVTNALTSSSQHTASGGDIGVRSDRGVGKDVSNEGR